MSVEFEEEKTEGVSSFTSRTVLGAATTPGIVQFLKNKNIVRDEKNAGRLLWVFVIVCLGASLIITLYALGFFSQFFVKNSSTQPIPYDEWKNLPKSVQNKIPHE